MFRGDWDAVAGTGTVEPEVTPEDEQELRRLIAEADRLQHLIASYMAHVNRQLETAPQLRRAVVAYTRGEGTAL